VRSVFTVAGDVASFNGTDVGGRLGSFLGLHSNETVELTANAASIQVQVAILLFTPQRAQLVYLTLRAADLATLSGALGTTVESVANVRVEVEVIPAPSPPPPLTPVLPTQLQAPFQDAIRIATDGPARPLLIGIVIGVCVLLGVVLMFGFWYKYGRRRKHTEVAPTRSCDAIVVSVGGAPSAAEAGEDGAVEVADVELGMERVRVAPIVAPHAAAFSQAPSDLDVEPVRATRSAPVPDSDAVPERATYPAPGSDLAEDLRLSTCKSPDASARARVAAQAVAAIVALADMPGTPMRRAQITPERTATLLGTPPSMPKTADWPSTPDPVAAQLLWLSASEMLAADTPPSRTATGEVSTPLHPAAAQALWLSVAAQVMWLSSVDGSGAHTPPQPPDGQWPETPDAVAARVLRLTSADGSASETPPQLPNTGDSRSTSDLAAAEALWKLDEDLPPSLTSSLVRDVSTLDPAFATPELHERPPVLTAAEAQQERRRAVTVDAVQWVASVTQTTAPPTALEGDEEALSLWLGSGKIITRLVEIIAPVLSAPILREHSPQKHPESSDGYFSRAQTHARHVEVVGRYLQCCRAVGVPEHDLFDSIDLVDGKDVPAVVRNLHSLGRVAQTMKNFEGPFLGARLATRNTRQFTQAQFAEARAEIPRLIHDQAAAGAHVPSMKSSPSISATYWRAKASAEDAPSAGPSSPKAKPEPGAVSEESVLAASDARCGRRKRLSRPLLDADLQQVKRPSLGAESDGSGHDSFGDAEPPATDAAPMTPPSGISAVAAVTPAPAAALAPAAAPAPAPAPSSEAAGVPPEPPPRAGRAGLPPVQFIPQARRTPGTTDSAALKRARSLRF